MIVTELQFSPTEGVAEDWLLRHWDTAEPDGVTEERFEHFDAATGRMKTLFSSDTEINDLLLARARDAVIVSNATPINTAKSSLRDAEGL